MDALPSRGGCCIRDLNSQRAMKHKRTRGWNVPKKQFWSQMPFVNFKKQDGKKNSIQRILLWQQVLRFRKIKKLRGFLFLCPAEIQSSLLICGSFCFKTNICVENYRLKHRNEKSLQLWQHYLLYEFHHKHLNKEQRVSFKELI